MDANPRFSEAHRASPRKPVNQSQREPAHREVAGGSRGHPETSAIGRRGTLIAAAERKLAEAYKSARAAGIDRDFLHDAFSPAVECLNEARHSGDLAGALAETRDDRYQARHRRMISDPVTPDAPGLDLCPDLDAVSTAAEFMDALRMFRVWAGEPSYREMERRCGGRYAASTLCTALKASKLPGLPLVQAAVIACGGREEHKQSFSSAWRRLRGLQQEPVRIAAQPTLTRVLRSVT
jgi:hypothetical protein